ncbi:MAG: glycerol-3-phosphate 1-O-acyltransferase PlsY [Proteobacteria bacterium]|nr:glycerol-3-phosphate 1-O-acyltransferase PlsY [Pseudomonadota bacterium]MDA0982822.1 glycerol-3-phosphate 1-O-acyltransferase PlsY [Pseudomonadota bacterium]
METALIALAAYCLGSISFAMFVSKLMGLPDPRSYGSNNPGATNVLRSGSKLAAALTLLGDTGKGALAVWLATLWTGTPAVTGAEAPIAGAMAFLGHLYPAFHGFKGGKGVATAAGVLLAIDPWLGLGVLGSFAIMVLFFRMVSLASITAALFAPVWAFWLFGMRPVVPSVAAIAILLIWRHHENIGRILRGQESRLGQRKT